jgi:ubiquitin conjugation factor E4 B
VVLLGDKEGCEAGSLIYLKIRNKRLAKLGAQSQPPKQEDVETSMADVGASEISSSTPSVNPTAPQVPALATNIHISPAPTTTTPDMKSINGEGIRMFPARSGQVTPRKRDASESTSRPGSRTGDSIETFEDRTLGAVFRITLNEVQKKDSNGNSLYYLVNLQQELQDQGSEIRLTIDVLDQALLEAASNLGKTAPLDYLLACWKRVSRLYRGFKKPNAADPKCNIVKEARRLCMSYCIFAATMPEMFGLDTPSSNPLTPHLLCDPDNDRGVCTDFLMEANARFAEDDSLKDMFASAVEEMSRQLAMKSMSDDYRPYVMSLKHLVRFPNIANAIVDSSMFCDESTTAADLSKDTLLGPYFEISPLQGDVTKQYFSSPKTRNRNYIADSQRALRMTLKTHQDDLLEIINQLIRTSKPAREKVLDWFALSVNTNHKRRALQVDSATVSTDGFMINVTNILDRLCSPFMDAAFTKVDRIDANYLKRQPRVDMKDETKLNANQSTSDQFYGQSVEGESNFISEVFFLCVAAHHYGTEAANSSLEQLEKELKRMEKQIDKFELERHKYVSNPILLAQFENALKKYKDRIDTGLSYKYSVQGVLLDDVSQASSMQFMRYVIVWLLRTLSPTHNFPQVPIKLPLPEPDSEVFRNLPEYFLDDIISNFKFIMWNMPQVIISTQAEELVILCITLLRNSEYVKNPYLKAGLVSILFRGTWPRPNGLSGVLVALLQSMTFANEHLLHSLMKFYIEAEFTGTHTQFFDKFNIRYEIFQIIKTIWPNRVYPEQLSKEAKLNREFFVRFVNLLLNDVTFVLDESFTAFLSIHDLTKELAQYGNTMDQTQKQEKEELLAAAQSRAKSYMQLTNETMSMLILFTEALPDSFTVPEIVQRLADMLDYNLDAMVGPKSANLKVDNLQEYHFEPRTLLAEIVEVYINLAHKDSFILAVARDGRSYKPANFEKSNTILKKYRLKSPDKIQKWEALQKKFKAAKEADEAEEEDLGEIPDEFLGIPSLHHIGGPLTVILICCRSTRLYSNGRSRHPS